VNGIGWLYGAKKTCANVFQALGFFFLKEALGLSEICFPYDAVT
jgi:hypothetical protein